MAVLWATILPEATNTGVWPAEQELTVAVGGSSAQTDAVAADRVRKVRISADVDCHFAIGQNPTATTSSAPLWANQVEYHSIKPGHKVAVIAAA